MTTISKEEARRLAGQLIMVRMPDTELSDDAAQFLRANHIRAVCLFRQNMRDDAQLRRLTADLRQTLGAHALIGIDQEGGAVVRATWLPDPPAAMALGAGDDPSTCRAVGAAVARGLRALGVNWNFAPVLDLNNNPDNPVIAERSFGSDPVRAAELALAWMAGSLEEGVACCVKHFPGHGDTSIDSHRDLPIVDKPRAALERLELKPFRLAVEHLAPAIMSAHIVYPALDATHPATLSRPILTGLLREQWHYPGVVITDGMDMHAIADRYGVGAAAVAACSAGADMVMALGTRQTQMETLDALTEAICSGHISASACQEKRARVDQLTALYPSRSEAYLTDVADRAIMAQAWQRGLTPWRQPRPPAPGTSVRLVMRADVVSDGVSEAGIAAHAVAHLLAKIYAVELVTFEQEHTFDWNSLPHDGRYVILASTSRIRYPQHIRGQWRPDLHLALWNPFHALDIDAPALISYGFSPSALNAVLAALRGTHTASARLPVQLDVHGA